MLTICLYRAHIKFCGSNFHVFDWQENSRGVNFHDYGCMVGTIVVEYARYLIFAMHKFSWIGGYHEIHKNLYTMKFNTCIVALSDLFPVQFFSLTTRHSVSKL